MCVMTMMMMMMMIVNLQSEHAHGAYWSSQFAVQIKIGQEMEVENK